MDKKRFIVDGERGVVLAVAAKRVPTVLAGLKVSPTRGGEEKEYLRFIEKNKIIL